MADMQCEDRYVDLQEDKLGNRNDYMRRDLRVVAIEDKIKEW